MRFKIIFSLVFIAALGVLAYFAYPVLKERYFEDTNSVQNDKSKTEDEDLYDYKVGENNLDIENNSGISAENDSQENGTAEEETKEETDETGVSANITAEDCDNECASFKDNASDLKYCQNICDLSPIKDSDNCESKSGTDKDYCFRNQAIAKTDPTICDSISDSKIKSSCKNRVTEDMLENKL